MAYPIVISLAAFSVVGIEGFSKQGVDFIPALWEKAEQKIADVAPSLRREGPLPIAWGLRSDFLHRLLPWENDYQEGLYLAGFELENDRLIPPEGWTKWDLPPRKYLVMALAGDDRGSFLRGFQEIQKRGYALVGAVCDHAEKGGRFLYFPIEALS